VEGKESYTYFYLTPTDSFDKCNITVIHEKFDRPLKYLATF
jgi:hypothetical protein